MTQWFYSEAGKQLGPVSEEDLASQFKNGRPLATLVWTQGMAEWKTAREVPPFAPPGSEPPPVPPSPQQGVRKTPNDPWTPQELVEVAKYQKYIQWLVLAYFAAMFVKFGPLVIGIVGMFFVYKLAAALRVAAPWLYLVAMFVPVISLLALLHIVIKATNVLRANGIRVSVMGAKMDDFDR